MKASFKKYTLHFKQPSGTSRGVLTHKESWFIFLEENGQTGLGECGLLRGLSIDDRADFEKKLEWACQNINRGLGFLLQELIEFPAIQFGLEQAFISLKNDDRMILFPSEFTEGKASIPINGLVWMGDKAFMKKQVEEKLRQGFHCIKLKIGAIDFEEELSLLKHIRSNFTSQDIEIRVDANGAFTPAEGLEKLKKLADFQLHSIEQPIKPGQWQEMARLCEASPLPIALDEELIGVFDVTKRQQLLQMVQPKYLILKPSLLGGIKNCEEWIALARELNIQWWVTSALESNVGLNAIAQWTYTLQNPLPQGLGTGALYTNNVDCPLTVQNGRLYYEMNKQWNFNNIQV